MNKINYILTTLLLGGAVVLNAQTPATVSDMQLADRDAGRDRLLRRLP